MHIMLLSNKLSMMIAYLHLGTPFVDNINNAKAAQVTWQKAHNEYGDPPN
jgi:hypothetical protein